MGIQKANDIQDRLFTLYRHVSPSGKSYIGITSRPVETRWGGNGCGYSGQTKFYNAIKKYGWDNFDHQILQTGLTYEKAREAEMKAVEEYNAFHDGYNATFGGDTVSPACTRAVDQYTLEGEHVATYESIIDGANALGIDDAPIIAALKGRTFSAGGYLWAYHGEEVVVPDRNIRYRDDGNDNLVPQFTARAHDQPEVLQYNLDGELVAEYKDAYEAVKATGFNIKAIRESCTKPSHRLVQNFSFMYRDQPYEIEKRKHYYKPIICGETRKIYKDVHEAGRELGISFSGLYKALKSKRHYTNGLHFFYKDEFDKIPDFDEFVRTHPVRKPRTPKEAS